MIKLNNLKVQYLPKKFKDLETREIAQKLKVCTALREGMSSVASTHASQLMLLTAAGGGSNDSGFYKHLHPFVHICAKIEIIKFWFQFHQLLTAGPFNIKNMLHTSCSNRGESGHENNHSKAKPESGSVAQ